MRVIGWCVVVVWVCAGVAAAAEEPVRTYSDPVYGFSLEVPELGDESAGAPVVQPVTFSAPARGGFAANCNVQVQSVDMTLEAYKKLSFAQLEAGGLELMETKERTVSGMPGFVMESAGPLGGRDLRFLALAVGGEGRFWLVTCTASAERFEGYRPAFTRVLESFEVDAAGD